MDVAPEILPFMEILPTEDIFPEMESGTPPEVQ